ncbi:MAG: hypothetical protein AB7Q42_24195 [Acidimicrobiia bacterium]
MALAAVACSDRSNQDSSLGAAATGPTSVATGITIAPDPGSTAPLSVSTTGLDTDTTSSPGTETTASVPGSGTDPGTETTSSSVAGQSFPNADPVTAFLVNSSIFNRRCGPRPAADVWLWGSLEGGPTHEELQFCVAVDDHDDVRLVIVHDDQVVFESSEPLVIWYAGPVPGHYAVRVTGVSRGPDGSGESVPTTGDSALDSSVPATSTAVDTAEEVVLGEASFEMTVPQDGHHLVLGSAASNGTLTLDVHGPDAQVRLGMAQFPKGSPAGTTSTYSEVLLDVSGGGIRHVVNVPPALEEGTILCFALLADQTTESCSVRVEVRS